MRVFLVEDEAGIAESLRVALNRDGFDVVWISDGNQAITRLRKEKYDVVILDILVPGMTGLNILQEARALGMETPVLLLTARGEISDKVLGLEAGADDYLSKPFAMEELVARVRALTRRKHVSANGRRAIADLSLDLVKRTAIRRGKPVELTSREFALLELLTRTPGHVYTRSHICEEVWNYHFDPRTNLVDVYVQRLRRKIDDESDVKLIHTIRGVGYSVAEKTP